VHAYNQFKYENYKDFKDLTYKEYKRICYAANKLSVNMLVYEGYKLKLGILGHLTVIKYKQKAEQLTSGTMSYDIYNRTGEKVFYPNIHSNFHKYGIRWVKNMNKNFRKFYFRGNKTNNKEIYIFFEILFYIYM
jgi:hypothetical protein